MKLTIIERGNYFCYLDGEHDEKAWIYRCCLTGGGRFGYKWAFKANEAAIFDANDLKVGSIYFWLRIFHPHEFHFELENNQKIKVQFENKWKPFPFTFIYNHDLYRMVAHHGHYRILYKNDVQVASFDKNVFTFLNRDCFTTRAEVEINKVMLFILAVFDDIWHAKDSTFTYDFGNLGYSKPIDNKNWRPK